MTALTYPDVLPGTIGLTSISGAAGRIIRLGQFLVLNPAARWLKRDNDPNIQHAFVYLGATSRYPEGAILEAEPGGARIRSVNEHPWIYWCLHIAGEYTAQELQAVADHAPEYEGIPYSFFDYFAIAAHRWHFPLPGLRRYIKTSKHEECAALCDLEYSDQGLKLFTDDRWQGDVMPMNLYYLDWTIENWKLANGL